MKHKKKLFQMYVLLQDTQLKLYLKELSVCELIKQQRRTILTKASLTWDYSFLRCSLMLKPRIMWVIRLILASKLKQITLFTTHSLISTKMSRKFLQQKTKQNRRARFGTWTHWSSIEWKSLQTLSKTSHWLICQSTSTSLQRTNQLALLWNIKRSTKMWFHRFKSKTRPRNIR